MFDIPRNQVAPVTAIQVRLDPAAHPFELANAAAIEANWQRESAANPALFDGQMVLLSELVWRDGSLEGRCHVIRYATLLEWRRNRPHGAEHAFAHAALVSSDNALIAIRMGRHTANPGQVYFAAGSFEPEDFRDGLVDVEANMAREVREETGLELASARREDIHHLFSQNATSVIFRRYYFNESADALAERIADHVAKQTEAGEEPEIEGPVIIRDAQDLPDGLASHMHPIVKRHFGG